MVRTINHLALVCSLWLVSFLAVATVPASVDQTQISLRQNLQLTIDLSSVDDNVSVDLSPLQDNFQVLGRSTQQSMSVINGRVSNKREMLVSLIPLNSGNLVIPKLNVGNDQTKAIKIKVSADSNLAAINNDQNIQISAEISNHKALVQQSLNYTVTLMIGQQVDQASLSDPKLIKGDAVLEPVGDRKEYKKVIKGKTYQVYEYNYSVLPQKSGQLVLAPIYFKAYKIDRRFGGGFNSLFDNFFNKDVFAQGGLSSGFGNRGKPIELATKKITIDVQPIPKNFRGNDWLPSQSVTLQSHWSNDVGPYDIGEPITRTITLTAEGVTASQLPELEIPKVAGVKQYTAPGNPEEKVVNGKKISQLTTQITVIPNQKGEIQFPEIKLPWWNLDTATAEVATLEPYTIHVATDVTNNNNINNGPLAPVTTSNNQSNPQIQQTVNANKDQSSSDAKKAVLNTKAKSEMSMVQFLQKYYWLILLVVLFIIVVIYLALKKRQSKTASSQNSPRANQSKLLQSTLPQSTTRPIDDLLKQLKKACDKNQPAEARKALVEIAKLLWPELPRVTLNTYLTSSKLSNSHSELVEKISKLNKALYQSNTNDNDNGSVWQSDDLYELIISLVKKNKTPDQQSRPLEPLFRT